MVNEVAPSVASEALQKERGMDCGVFLGHLLQSGQE
jgi:hypothetical protein